MAGGRWAVITGRVVTRHRSLAAARSVCRVNATLHAQLRRWSRRLALWDAELGMYMVRRWP